MALAQLFKYVLRFSLSIICCLVSAKAIKIVSRDARKDVVVPAVAREGSETESFAFYSSLMNWNILPKLIALSVK